MLHSAWCVHHRPAVTFVRRLARDLKERRKPPVVLVRRGLALMRAEPEIVRRQTDARRPSGQAADLEQLPLDTATSPGRPAPSVRVVPWSMRGRVMSEGPWVAPGSTPPPEQGPPPPVRSRPPGYAAPPPAATAAPPPGYAAPPPGYARRRRGTSHPPRVPGTASRVRRSPARRPRVAGLEFRPGIIPLRPLTLGDLYGAVTKAIRGNVAATIGLAVVTSLVCLVPTTALGAWIASQETAVDRERQLRGLRAHRQLPAEPRLGRLLGRPDRLPRLRHRPGRHRPQGGHRRDLGRHQAPAARHRRGRGADDRRGARSSSACSSACPSPGWSPSETAEAGPILLLVLGVLASVLVYRGCGRGSRS